MTENRPGPDETQGKGAEDVAQSPSRRRVLKAAAAAAPIIMSIKARPAFAGPETSSSLSHNMSQQPAAARVK
jgi:hypothetical protein